MRNFIFILCSVILASCEAEKEELLITPSDLTTITLNGDVIVSKANLTRSSGTIMYYAFEVDEFYTDTKGNTIYNPYAEGVFNTTTQFQVRLDKNTRYRIRAAIVEEQSEKLYSKVDDCIQEPFTSDNEFAPITNKFVYGSDKVNCLSEQIHFRIYNGLSSGKYKSYPVLNYYVGEEFVTGNGNITINMTRKNTGLKFQITPPKEGTLAVTNVYYEPFFSFSLTADSQPVDTTIIYAMPATYSYAPMKLSVIWTDSDGNENDLSLPYMDLENKTLTTISIDINGRISSSGGSSSGTTGSNVPLSLNYSTTLSSNGVIEIN